MENHSRRLTGRLKKLAGELWSGLDGRSVKAVKRGKGELLFGMTMEEALKHIGCVPDCGLPADAPVLYGHRSAEDADIYFISNQKDEMIEIRPEFRIRSRHRNCGMRQQAVFVRFRPMR